MTIVVRGSQKYNFPVCSGRVCNPAAGPPDCKSGGSRSYSSTNPIEKGTEKGNWLDQVWALLEDSLVWLPGFLLPYFLRKKIGWREGLFFVIGFIPSILFTLRSEYIFRIFTPGYMPTNCNSYTWNIFDAEKLCGTPFWLVVANALLTYSMLILCLVFAIRRVLPAPSAVEGSPSKGRVLRLSKVHQVFEYLGLALIIVFLKSITWAQFWYIPTLPLFALTIEEPRERRLFFSLCLFEMAAIHNLVIAPFGWFNPSPPYQYMWGL
jgi:hypothetical protein